MPAALPPPALVYAPPPDTSLDLLHADAALIVAIKPPGLLSVPGRGPQHADCLASRVQARFADALVVHRLDLGTSGIVCFGRGAAAQRELSRQFAARETRKRYLAVVAGRPAAPSGSIDLPLAADWPNRPRQKVCAATGKPALTHWRVLGPAPGGSRLELVPVTGRSHQLRVHLMALGHPILGDELYADAAALAAAPRLLLHASGLELAHPVGGQLLAFTSEAGF
ncbi:pseudouridine synthase [Derxia lacustris]|uniref:pseudouridine synthase n=1 Tax=Derxia lacustris TaxID=764842 RepID=UPI000A16EC30|nr:pseudouridine synthase [Derxia lacustris]